MCPFHISLGSLTEQNTQTHKSSDQTTTDEVISSMSPRQSGLSIMTNRLKDFPAEIRDLIWDCAIRDNSPAAHIYQSTTPGTKTKTFAFWTKTIQALQHLSASMSPPSPGATRSRHLGTFWAKKSANVPWSRTACYESRQRMLSFLNCPEIAVLRISGALCEKSPPAMVHIGFQGERWRAAVINDPTLCGSGMHTDTVAHYGGEYG